MIVSYACTINVSLALALAFASVISYNHKWCSKLWHHLWSSFMIVTYDGNRFIIQATGASFAIRCQHGSGICFATLSSEKNANSSTSTKAREKSTYFESINICWAKFEFIILLNKISYLLGKTSLVRVVYIGKVCWQNCLQFCATKCLPNMIWQPWVNRTAHIRHQCR